MARKKTLQVKEDVTCNLIPMVDIMFLLLLFFILGADMSQRETEDLVLPQADQVQEQPKEKSSDERHTTVNLFHRPAGGGFSCPAQQRGVCRDTAHYAIAIRGKEYTYEAFPDQIKSEADAALEPDVDPAAGKRLSATKVTIRADRAAPFGMVQKIIEVCGLAGIYKIEVGAARPPEG